MILTLATAAAVATAGTGAAQAAGSYPYKISIRGEQRHEWSYTGNAADSCATPEDGKGEQHFTFRSAAPYRTIVARAGGTGRWGTQATWKLKASGTRTGTHTRYFSRAGEPLCVTDDARDPETGCGPQSWTIDAFMQYGLGKPRGRMQVTSAAGFASPPSTAATASPSPAT